MKKYLLSFVIVAMLTGCSGQASKTLSPEEQLALQYVEQFQNGKDVDVKKKFVDEHVDESAKPLFMLAANAESDEKAALSNVEVVGMVDAEKSNGEGKLVLVRGKDSAGNAKEEIFVFKNGKFLFGFTESSGKENFDKLRSQFK